MGAVGSEVSPFVCVNLTVLAGIKGGPEEGGAEFNDKQFKNRFSEPKSSLIYFL